MKKSYFSKRQSEGRRKSIKRVAVTQADTLTIWVLVIRTWVLTFKKKVRYSMKRIKLDKMRKKSKSCCENLHKTTKSMAMQKE